MPSKNLFLAIILVLVSAHSARASSDDSCIPTWTLNHGGYARCSSLPLLTPSNDTRVNLKLLLADAGLGTLAAKAATKDEAEYSGYGKVPFSLENFEDNIFIPRDGSNVKDETAAYDGNRCNSNESGKEDFIGAVNQSKDLSPAERKLLAEERQKLAPTCIDTPAAKPPIRPGVSHEKSAPSPAHREFTQYISAAAAFYEGRYDEAGSGFAGLANSSQPWIRESSRYMLGRTQLNRSQQNAHDAAGFFDMRKIDARAIQEAEARFGDYLKDYPAGRYAASARGLLRRVYWLSGQQKRLADEYDWQLRHPESPQHSVSINGLVQEADAKLFPGGDPGLISNPLFLATLNLSLMRSGSAETADISLSDLQKQQSYFGGHKALYEYLLAAHYFYVQKDAARALERLSDAIPTQMTYLDFSRLVLRGVALEATGNYPAARVLWLKLLPLCRQPLQNETLQLALAINYERSNDAALAFEPKSPVTEPELRTILLRNAASADLLRRLVASRDSTREEQLKALYTLLYKDLLQGHYQDYIKDYPLLPPDAAQYTPSPGEHYRGKPQLAHFTWAGRRSDDSYGCPSTLDIAGKLAKNADDPQGLLCLADFVKFTRPGSGAGLTWFSAEPPTGIRGPVLGSAPSHFPGKLFSRGEAYKMVIADPKASPDQKAYALYRAVKCYAPSGNNGCGGDAVDKSVRKSWFRTLKTQHKNSVWAKSIVFYW